ncbi:hypothetical protein EUGRSUZ_B02469 [Eucalyptus grandis]|uniref:Uncharacterized protein n=2 Tax=Eucalyptus grandis TaxID=71139 RepID=A0ACC3LTU9_EUCGR|nr:hypothetical protein EUGRSUZ_B02469 [Eucalyptus grandis]
MEELMRSLPEYISMIIFKHTLKLPISIYTKNVLLLQGYTLFPSFHYTFRLHLLSCLGHITHELNNCMRRSSADTCKPHPSDGIFLKHHSRGGKAHNLLSCNSK